MKTYSTLAAITALLACKICANPNPVHDSLKAQHLTRSSDLQSSYDYVVVGGGTSGLTVADRLTESGKCLWELA